MLPLVLFLAFLLVPALEIYLIIQVAALIGGWPTAALLVAGSVLGGWLIRREGRRAWRGLQEALRSGAVPEQGQGGSGVLMAGGLLLLVPGFVTDVLGLLCVLPFTRPPVRRAMSRYAERRRRIAEERLAEAFPEFRGGVPGFPGFPGVPGEDGPEGAPGSGPVIRGQVIHDDSAGGAAGKDGAGQGDPARLPGPDHP